MNIKKVVDDRILDLEKKYKLSFTQLESGQMWARLNELRELKRKFTDKDGNWII